PNSRTSQWVQTRWSPVPRPRTPRDKQAEKDKSRPLDSNWQRDFRMACSILLLWLLVVELAPHACDEGIPPTSLTLRISPTPVIQRAPPPIFNNQKLALSLYRQLPVTAKSKNIIFSPLSMAVPLTLLAFQEKPEVRNLVLQDLGFKVTKDLDAREVVHYGKYLRALLHTEQCGVHTGSLLFMDKKLKPKQKFLSLAQGSYNSDVILVSFGNYKLAPKQINSAVRNRTHGKVRRLVKDLKPIPNLLLANYIFFKGKWKYRFNPRFTEIRPFLTDKGIQVMVPMMYREGWFQLQYFPHMHSHVLQLPYTCNISGVFILPNEGKFEESEKALLEESFDTWIKPLPLSMRRLYFPKFSISVDLPLEHFKYPTSGLSLFYEHMDLSGIALPNAPLKVTTVAVLNIIHMALALQMWRTQGGLVTAHTMNDSTAESSMSPHRGLAPTNVDFAFNLYRHLSTLDPHSNVLISPVSVSMALAMMSLGTLGPTQTQLLQDFGFNMTELSKDEIYLKFRHLTHLLSQSDSNLEMSVGNAMFLHQTLKLKDSFLADMAHYYESEVLTINFNDWTEASKLINRHVESKTQGEISHVFSAQESPAALILVNYIILKGTWELPFNPENTRDEDFHVNETSTVRVPMMFQSGHIGYLNDLKIPCQVVKMNYLGNGTTFFILPHQGQMDTVIKALNRDTIERWDELLTKRLVNLHIPKISMSGIYNLEDVLAGMGITDLFTGQAAFSNTTQDSPLTPIKMIHKAVLQLDETGGRRVATREASQTSKPLTVTFERPFILLMFDNFTWSSLLFAKIMNPA
ncbi:hypothetical protein STEG23_019770, partial [Scotinomys teguina]